MIIKPSIWDYKYDKMSTQEARLNYDRDMMLYEQTVALQNMSNQNNSMEFGDSVALLLTPANKEDMLPCGVFSRGTKEYNHFEKLRLQRLGLLNKRKDLYLRKGGLILFTLISNAVFMPLTLIVNHDALKIQLIVFLFQVALGMILISVGESYKRDADILLEKRNQYVKRCKDKLEQEKQEKERLKQEEIIRNTEHLTFELEDDE